MVPNDFPIEKLMKEDALRVFFEPVLSLKRQDVLGVSTLFAAEGAPGPLSYRHLAEPAAAQGKSLEQDRFLRRKALEAFRPLHAENKDFLLFLNFDTSIIDQGIVGSGLLAQSVRELGLHPHSIVIEILESQAKDVDSLVKFIRVYRENGFLIALGGVGAGHSNLTRIFQTKPDLLKIDPALAHGIGTDYYQREIFKALANLARNLGTLVLAEGMEEERDILPAWEMGVDLVQGRFLKDSYAGTPEQKAALKERMTALASTFKGKSVKRSRSTRSRFAEHDATFATILKELGKETRENFNGKLAEFARLYPSVECLYILDEKGAQITDTVSLPGKLIQQRSLFRPATIGADHSSKEYYYLLIDTFVNKYTTEPYISLASGNLCVTLSGLFKDVRGGSFVLCVDFPVEG